MNSRRADFDALEHLRHELEHPPFHALLKPQAVAADAASGQVIIRLPFSPTLLGAAGADFVHGGVIAMLIDMAAHAAVAIRIRRMAPTVDLRIDYLSPAAAADLTATARALRVGRVLARVDVEVTGPDGSLYAVGRGTFCTLAPTERTTQSESASECLQSA